ncbi:techylectin-5A [Nephila pilipes]|uniref:Techylectin-5A n=1 Tax=Nephila pilipes TaxID=299642 RepID=A0A8X6MP29_NEPPI|nr:techylectin-5A [Nephila pilipes]
MPSSLKELFTERDTAEPSPTSHNNNDTSKTSNDPVGVLCLNAENKTDSKVCECGKKEQCLIYLEITRSLLLEVRDSILKRENITCEGSKFESTTQAKDCTDLLSDGKKKSGVYTVWPTTMPEKSLQVYCDMETDGGGWTVFQRRGNYSNQTDFHQLWSAYKTGFGNITRDFWLGNDNIYYLTNQGNYELRFDLMDVRGIYRFAVYQNFKLGDIEEGYRLHIGPYSGNAGDGFKNHKGRRFSTRDVGEDSAASSTISGGWWFNKWAYVHLNGMYMPAVDDPKAIHWFEWRKNEGLFNTEMKIRRN